MKRKLGVFAAVAVLAAAYVPAAFAGEEPPPKPGDVHCNAGRGNGSEGCDPGKSSTNPNGTTGQNMGGDEGGPISGGTGVL